MGVVITAFYNESRGLTGDVEGKGVVEEEGDLGNIKGVEEDGDDLVVELSRVEVVFTDVDYFILEFLKQLEVENCVQELL